MDHERSRPAPTLPLIRGGIKRRALTKVSGSGSHRAGMVEPGTKEMVAIGDGPSGWAPATAVVYSSACIGVPGAK